MKMAELQKIQERQDRQFILMGGMIKDMRETLSGTENAIHKIVKNSISLASIDMAQYGIDYNDVRETEG